MSKKPDVDELQVDVQMIQEFLTDDNLKRGRDALLGESSVRPSTTPLRTTSSFPSPARVLSGFATTWSSKTSEIPVETIVTEPIKSDEEDDEEDEEDEDDPKTEYADPSAIIAKQITVLNDAVRQLFKRAQEIQNDNNLLAETVKKQEVALRHQDSIQKKYEAEIASLKTHHTTQIAELTTRINNAEKMFTDKIRDSLSTIKETPELIERLVQATNMALSNLPQDVQTTLGEVKLTENEKKTVEKAKNLIAPPKMKKLPRHMRPYNPED
jgi:hypothetical protein